MSKLVSYVNENHLPTETDSENNNYLWKRHAADALGVAEKTLERQAAAGKIKQIEKSRKIYYLLSDLIVFETAQQTETHKAVVMSDNQRQTPTTDNENMSQALQLNNAMPPAGAFDVQSRYVNALTEKTESEAKKAYYDGNITFPLHEAADVFNLSIVDLKASAKTFKGKNQKLMITKTSLEKYLKNL